MKYISFRHLHLFLVAALLVALLGVASPAVPARAASLTVTTNADTITVDGACSLREAITNANGDSQLSASSGECAAGSGTDTITFDGTVFNPATITLGSALPTLNSNMTIDGSANSAQVTVNGNDSVTVFTIASGKTVELKNLTIEHGSAFNGGGIYNSGTLTITNSQILNNSASNAGSGIFNNVGTITINGSTIANNSPRSGYGQFDGTLTVTNSTFTGNYGAAAGGAIMMFGGTATVNQATIYGNASQATGGIYNGGSVSNVQVRNSIITGNTSDNPNFPNCYGVSSLGYNLFGATGYGCMILVNDKTSDTPGLDALANNGGPTKTMALLSGSPAIASADTTTCLSTDQRGFARDASCDIGAYELLPGPELTITKTNDVSGSVALGNSWTWTVRVTNNGTTNSTFASGQTILSDNFPTNANYSLAGRVISNYTGSIPTESMAGSDLSVVANGSITLHPGGYYETSYTVTPIAAGIFANPRAGGICQADPDNIIAETAEGNNTCSDTVTVLGPEVGLSDTSLNFGNQGVGTSSAPQTVTLTNTGDADLHVGSLSINSDFGLSNDNCSSATVAPGNTCTFDVTFQPLSTGAKNGTVSIPSDAPSTPDSVSLSGSGVILVSSTFNSVGAYDGQIIEKTETFNNGGTVNTLGGFLGVGDTSFDQQVLSFLHFDTSSLPDTAVITGLTIQVKQYQILGTNPLNTFGPLYVDVASPYFGAEAAVKATDFQASAGASDTGFFNTTPLSGNWFEAVLGSSAFPYLNLSGTTQFRIHFNIDDNDNLKNDLFRFFSGNAIAAYRPVLIVQYFVP